jgi:hypothetical protein
MVYTSSVDDNLIRAAVIPVGVLLFLGLVKLLAWGLYHLMPHSRLRTELFMVRWTRYRWLRRLLGRRAPPDA